MASNSIDILVNATDRASSVFGDVGDNVGKMSQAIKDAEKGSKILTGAVAGLGLASVMAFTGFDDSMRNVQATMGSGLGDSIQEVEQNITSLRDKAKEMGSTTAFSASQSADAMGKLALAGWDTDQILAGIGPSLNLASAGSMDLATSADIMTDTMSAFQIEAEKAEQTADIFALTASSTNTDVMQLGEAMKYAGGEAYSAGMSLADTNSILGYFANTGIKGSQAGTTFSSMLRDMRANAEDGAFAIGDTTVALYDQNGEMRNVIDIMGDVEGATSGMTDSQRDQALSSVFQSQSMKGVNSIMAQGVDGLVELSGELNNADGTAQSMADTMEGGLGGSFRGLKSATEGLFIAIGEQLAPALQVGIDFIAGLARQAIDVIGNLEQFKGVLIIVTGAILMGMVPAFIALAGAVWSAMAPLLPFLAIGALIGLLAWQIMENWSTFAPYFQGIFDFVSTAVEGFKSVFMQSFQNLKNGLTPIWEAVKTLLRSLEPIIMLVGAVLGVLLVTAMAIFNGIVSAIAPLITAFLNIVDVVVNVVNAVIAVLTGDWQGAMDYWNSATESAVEFFKNIWDAIKNFFSSFVSTFVSILSSFGIDVVGKFTEMWEGAKSKVSSGIDAVTGFFKGLPPKVMSFLISLAVKAVAKFTEMMGNAKDRVSTGISNVVSFFSGLPSKAMAHIIRLATDLVSKFTSMMGDAKSAVSKGITNVIDTIKNFGSQFLSAGKGLLKELVSGITSGIGKAKDAVKSGMDTLRNLLPFSPAKEGPLSDLDKSGESFFPTWYEGALEQVRPMQRAIAGAMNDINDSVESDTGSIGLEAFTGGKTRMTVVHRHEHNGTVEVKGDNSRDSVNFVKKDITTRTEDTFTSDLRRVVRST